MKPILDNVLVKIKKDELYNNSMVVGDGHKIYLSHDFEPEKMLRTKFIVEEVPLKLSFSKEAIAQHMMDKRKKPMSWKTTIDIQKGDTIYVNYNGLLDSLGTLADKNCRGYSDKYFEDGDDLYIFIHYSDLLMRERNGEISPLNGLTICKLLYEKDKFYNESKIILLEKSIKTEHFQFAQVMYADDNIESIIELGKIIDIPKFNLKKNDVIAFKKQMFVPVVFSWLNQENLVYIKRQHIQAVLDGDVYNFLDMEREVKL